MISYYEKHADRIPAEILPKLSKALTVSIEDFLGVKPESRKKVKPQNKSSLNKFLQIEKLPQRDREIVIRMIDDLLVKNTVKK